MTSTRSNSTADMTNKINDCVQVNLRITTNSNQGGRKYMEDTHAIALQRLNPLDKESPISLAYFGIFDGHGGKEAAEFARQKLCQHILEQDEFWPNTNDDAQNDQSILTAIRKGFLACHNDMWNYVGKWTKTSSGLPSTSGCTASVVFIRGNKIYIGHVGDSAIVLGEGETLYKPWTANRLTRDHKPEDPLELKRIQDSGGNVLCKAGVHRVVWNRQKSITNSSHQYRHRHQHSITTMTTNGTTIEYEQIPFLAVSRALGDLWSLNTNTNLYSVSPEPELSVIEINPNQHRCLILASDGLWNMVTPEATVEIVRNCDIKTEEMILKAEDDDHRPFRNPSHELVQKALGVWRERMLRSDNITCVTVMLDPPGPPFSDCIVKKKKERLTYSMSSSTASVCSDDTVELDSLSPNNSTAGAFPKNKPPLERKEHILTPILNGPTPVRTPKRPASEDSLTSHVDTSRRKLAKTKQQKENGRTSPSRSSESELLSTLISSSSSSTNSKDDEQNISSLSEQTPNLSIIDNNDSIQNIEQSFCDNSEQQIENNSIEIDQSSNEISNDQTEDKLKNCHSRSSVIDKNFKYQKSSPTNRRRSVSTTFSMNNEIKFQINSSRRRKSFCIFDSNKEIDSKIVFGKKSLSTKFESSIKNDVFRRTKQSVTNRVRQAILRSQKISSKSHGVTTTITSKSSSSSTSTSTSSSSQ